MKFCTKCAPDACSDPISHASMFENADAQCMADWPETPQTAKHTSGPWKIAKDTYGVERIWDSKLDCDVACTAGDGSIPREERQANTILIASSPRMFEVLEQVIDSPREPDKWAQNVRFVLQQADGVERRPQSAEKCRKDLQVQRAASALLEALVLALPYVETAETDLTYKNCAVALATAQMRAAIAKAEGKS